MKLTLAAARINKGLSQAAAAELIGVSLQSVWSWENGSGMSQIHLKKAAEIYGIPKEKLIYTRAKKEKKRNV